MGVHQESRYRIYWELDREEGPQHSIRNYISINRYETLRRYLHISDPIQLPPEPRDEEEEKTLTPKIIKKLWWWKLKPLISRFRDTYQTYYISRNDVAIDEIMVRFFGRSLHTYKIPGKPIKQGYKIFALADRGYV